MLASLFLNDSIYTKIYKKEEEAARHPCNSYIEDDTPTVHNHAANPHN
jgi:hypothetical protein